MTGQFEEIRDYIADIEFLLVELGAREKDANNKYNGMHGKITDVEEALGEALAKKLRWISSVRNKFMHEAGAHIDNFEHYKEQCELAHIELGVLTGLIDSKDLEGAGLYESSSTQDGSERLYSSTHKSNNSSISIGKIIGWVIPTVVIVSLVLFILPMSGEAQRAKIILNNHQLSFLKESLKNKYANLEELEDKQGLIRTIFNDTEEVDTLDEEISELNNKINNLEEENEDLLKKLND